MEPFQSPGELCDPEKDKGQADTQGKREGAVYGDPPALLDLNSDLHEELHPGGR